MPEQPIDFGAGQASGLEELAGAAPVFWNLMSSPDGTVRMRPLLTTWGDFETGVVTSSAVIGIFPWRQYVVFVTADRKIWAWLGPSNVVALSDATSATQLDGTGRPIFTYDATRVVIAGGGAPQKWEGAGLSARLGGTPPNMTHLGYSSTRFIGNQNDNSGIIQWSDVGVTGHETWLTTAVIPDDADPGDMEAEAAPDPVVALSVSANEVYAFGTETLQVLYPDPSTAFSVASTVALGCGAAYSVINTDSQYAWLDDRKRFVQSSGRDFTVLSSPAMARSLDRLETVSDCWGCRIRIASYDLLLWTFPTAGRTLYYDRDQQKWGEWKSRANGTWAPWVGQSYAYWAEKDLHLVGLSDGTIALLSLDTTTELGETPVGVSQTGFDNAGTLVRKLCQRLQVQMKRGETLQGAATVPVVEIAYRDDLGSFRPALQLSLGAGDYQPTVEKWGLGMYKQRQWRLTYSGTAEFMLAKAIATLEMAES